MQGNRNRSLFTSFSFGILTLLAACVQQPTQQSAETEKFTLLANPAEKRIDVLVDGAPFTSYIYPDALKKPVLYPVLSPAGNPITRGWPFAPREAERIDHPHQVGMWLNYGNVNGLDFWNNSEAIPQERRQHYGTIRHQAVTHMQSGNDKAELQVRAHWQKPDSTVLLREETTFIFSGTPNSRTIDRITTLTATDEDVLFKDSKEGMYAIRVARELEHLTAKPSKYIDAAGKEQDLATGSHPAITGNYHSSEGISGEEVWGSRAKWVELTGTIRQEPVSLILLDHPKNIGYPTYWMARGYGLFSANPLGQKEMSGGKEELNFRLAAGNSVTFRYRFIVQSGNRPTQEQLNAAFEKFSASE